MGVRQFLVPAENCDEDLGSSSLAENSDYFAVKVLEMRLAKTRSWFVDRNPMLYVRTSFLYGGEQRHLPFVLGPPAQDDAAAVPAALPADLVAQDVLAAGWHPYRGKGLALLVALYSVPDDSQLTAMLSMIDRLITAAKLVPGLGAYLTVVDAVQQGVTTIGGGSETKSVLGWQRSFDGAALRPGMWVLATKELEPRAAFVRHRRLVYGNTGAPPDGVDYVLLSIERTTSVDGAGDLPDIAFLRRLVNDYAGIPGDEAWDLARAHLASLATAVLNSPDLTHPQAESLVTAYRMGAKQRRVKVMEAAARSGSPSAPLPAEAGEALAMLRTDDQP
ncbi:MAG: hypothetical protein ABWY29_10625 [Blastococcus sp.]